MFFHFIEESSLESLAQIRIVKMPDIFPEAILGEATFGKKAVDIGIPVERAAKGVKNA